MSKRRKSKASLSSADFDEVIIDRLRDVVSPLDDTAGAADQAAFFERVYMASIVALAEETAAHVVKQAPRRLGVERRGMAGFTRRLERAWRSGLASLATLRALHTEYGEAYYRSGLMDPELRDTGLFQATARLHGRSCRVAMEVQTLLQAGLPDGALARWRTLHEIAVVALFVVQHGEDAARAYLDHDVVQRFRLMSAHATHSPALGWEPVDSEEQAELTKAYQAIIAGRGKDFAKDYGWAGPFLGNPRPTLADLERAVRLDRFRPFYSWASGGVHAGSHGLVPIGAHIPFGGPMAAGATNRGLVDPGQNTAIALSQIAAALMMARPTPYFTHAGISIDKLAKRCQDAFVADNDIVEARTARDLARRTPQ